MAIYQVIICSGEGISLGGMNWPANSIEDAIFEILSCEWEPGTSFMAYLDSYSDDFVTFKA